MIQKIKKFFVVAIAALSLAVPGLVPALASTAYAATIDESLCSGSEAAATGDASGGCGDTGTDGSTIATAANKIVNIFSVIVGAVAIIMIIYGGFRYITSGGDSNSVGSAKNTLIYAIVGLIIVALAQFLVHFVINTTTDAVPPQ
jgi:hypothetical protein